MRYRLFFLAFSGLLALLLVFVLAWKINPEKLLFGAGLEKQSDKFGELFSYEEELPRVKKIFEKKSTREAYKEFASIYNDPVLMRNMVSIHNLAHWVGAQIYFKEGMDGITICDHSFDGGCYHGFFGQAISTEGKDALINAEKYCMGSIEANPAKYGECVHGLGHGVLPMYEYTIEGVTKALKDCDLLEHSKTGCYNGVFMEYNTNTMQLVLKGEINTANPNNDRGIMEPCDSMDPVYREYCYYEQPQWWLSKLGNKFSEMAGLCGTIPDKNSRESCLSGIGRAVISWQTFTGGAPDIKKSGRICADIGVPGVGPYCLSEIIKVSASTHGRDIIKMCELLENKEEQQLCISRITALGLSQ